MSLTSVTKAKIPTFPKEINDKAIEASFRKWEANYAGIQTAAKAFAAELGRLVNPTFGTTTFECLKKLKDKNLDPKQKKALEDLHSALSKLEGYVARIS